MFLYTMILVAISKELTDGAEGIVASVFAFLIIRLTP